MSDPCGCWHTTDTFVNDGWYTTVYYKHEPLIENAGPFADHRLVHQFLLRIRAEHEAKQIAEAHA